MKRSGKLLRKEGHAKTGELCRERQSRTNMNVNLGRGVKRSNERAPLPESLGRRTPATEGGTRKRIQNGDRFPKEERTLAS